LLSYSQKTVGPISGHGVYRTMSSLCCCTYLRRGQVHGMAAAKCHRTLNIQRTRRCGDSGRRLRPMAHWCSLYSSRRCNTRRLTLAPANHSFAFRCTIIRQRCRHALCRHVCGRPSSYTYSPAALHL